MSTVGKVFVVLNLALAALFVGAAASLIGTSEAFRGKYETELSAHKTDNDKHKITIGALEGENGELKRQNQSRADRVKQLEAEVDSLTADVEDERRQNSDLREGVSGIESKLGDLEQTNRSLTNQLSQVNGENQNLREERDQSLDERDSALALQNRAEESSRSATGRADNLRLELARTTDRAESAEAKLGAIARQYNLDLNDLSAQPDLEGVVLSASYQASPAIVMINLGREHKIKPGFTFDVYSGASYKGRIRVEVVNTANASCTIALAGQSQISRGDRIVTNL